MPATPHGPQIACAGAFSDADGLDVRYVDSEINYAPNAPVPDAEGRVRPPTPQVRRITEPNSPGAVCRF